MNKYAKLRLPRSIHAARRRDTLAGFSKQFRNWAVLVLLAAAVLAGFADDAGAMAALLVAALVQIAAGGWQATRHTSLIHKTRLALLKGRIAGLTGKPRSPLQSRLQQLSVQSSFAALVLGLLFALIAQLGNLSSRQTLFFIAAGAAASIPAGLVLVAMATLRWADPKRAANAIIVATRCAVVDNISEVLLLTISLAVTVAFHIPPAVTVVQLLGINMILQIAPLVALGWDARAPKSRLAGATEIGFANLAAGLAYANYLLFFVRGSLSPAYISTHNPLYFQATGLAVLTLLLCQSVHILLVRADEHDGFFGRHLNMNPKLLWGFALSLFLFIAMAYVPFLNRFFGMHPLTLSDWAWAVVAAGGYLGVGLTQRHTRKHSRHAVLALHKQFMHDR